MQTLQLALMVRHLPQSQPQPHTRNSKVRDKQASKRNRNRRPHLPLFFFLLFFSLSCKKMDGQMDGEDQPGGWLKLLLIVNWSIFSPVKVNVDYCLQKRSHCVLKIFKLFCAGWFSRYGRAFGFRDEKKKNHLTYRGFKIVYDYIYVLGLQCQNVTPIKC